MNRSKRLCLGPLTSGPVSHLKVAYHIPSWSCLLSSFSWFWMYSRITVSSRPTVETKNPLAQKCSPTKLRFLPQRPAQCESRSSP